MTPNPPDLHDSPAASASMPSVAALLDRLTQQRDLYEQLKLLSAQQTKLIAEARTEQLLGVLSERQRLVDRIGTLSQEIAPYRQHWPQLSKQIDEQDRQRVNGLIEQVETLLQSIVEQDDQDRARLLEARQKVAGEMEQVRQGSRALNAYKSAPSATGMAARFTDQRG